MVEKIDFFVYYNIQNISYYGNEVSSEQEVRTRYSSHPWNKLRTNG